MYIYTLFCSKYKLLPRCSTSQSVSTRNSQNCPAFSYSIYTNVYLHCGAEDTTQHPAPSTVIPRRQEWNEMKDATMQERTGRNYSEKASTTSSAPGQRAAHPRDDSGGAENTTQHPAPPFLHGYSTTSRTRRDEGHDAGGNRETTMKEFHAVHRTTQGAGTQEGTIRVAPKTQRNIRRPILYGLPTTSRTSVFFTHLF